MAPTVDDVNCDEIVLLVQVGTFRSVLKTLRMGGDQWFLSSDPADAVEDGYVIVGCGEPLCSDSLNAAFFRIPVIEAETVGLADSIYVVIAPSVIEHIDTGYCEQSAWHARDCVEDFERFYGPLREALGRLQAARDCRLRGEEQLHNRGSRQEE